MKHFTGLIKKSQWKSYHKMEIPQQTSPGLRRSPAAKGLRTNPNATDPQEFPLQKEGIASSTSEMFFCSLGSIDIFIVCSNYTSKILWQSKTLLKRKGISHGSASRARLYVPINTSLQRPVLLCQVTELWLVCLHHYILLQAT